MPAQMRTLRFWVGLIIILASLYVYYLGHHIQSIDPKVDRTAFIAAIWKHVGYASLLFVPLALYIFLYKKGGPVGPSKAWEQWVMRLFQITFLLKMITGPLAVWTRGSTWKVFDWFEIPSPMERMDGPHEFMEQFHILLGYPLMALFGLLIIIVARQAIAHPKLKSFEDTSAN